MTRGASPDKILPPWTTCSPSSSRSEAKFGVFNGCSTQEQVDKLLGFGVRTVVATSRAVRDDVATAFAAFFYVALARGADIRVSFQQASGAVKAQLGVSEVPRRRAAHHLLVTDLAMQGMDDTGCSSGATIVPEPGAVALQVVSIAVHAAPRRALNGRQRALRRTSRSRSRPRLLRWRRNWPCRVGETVAEGSAPETTTGRLVARAAMVVVSPCGTAGRHGGCSERHEIPRLAHRD